MTRDTSTASWMQLSCKARLHWARLTQDDCQAIEGNLDRLTGRLQLRYGLARRQAEDQVRAFLKRFERGTSAATAREKAAAGL